MTEKLSSLMMPFLMVILSVILLFSKKDHLSDFTSGAKSGIKLTVNLLPTLIMLMVGVNMISKSGLSDFIATSLSAVGKKLGIPSELMPLIVVRPFSGSGSSAILLDIFEKYGADSFIGICASVIFGSSETVLYVVSVYFGCVEIKKTRHALPCAFAVMIFCIVLTCRICALLT